MAVLNLEWTSQSADVLVTIEGGTMLYSNDASSANPIWQRLQPGVDICLARGLEIGVGPHYVLKEEVACTVTKCGFNDPVTAMNLDGSMVAEGGSLTSTNQMFHNCSGLDSLIVSNLDTSEVTDMLSMFYNVKVPTLDVSTFDTNLVTDMQSMFNNCSGLSTLDISNFKTTNVTTMLGMFASCSGLTEIDCSSFDTTNVTNMSAMFRDCSSMVEVDVKSFNTSQVTIVTQMFSGCSSLLGIDLMNFDMNQMNAMTNMLWGCSSLTCVTNMNTVGAVNGRGGIFTGCTSMIFPDSATQLLLTTPTTGVGGSTWQNVAPCPPPVFPLSITWDSQLDDTSVYIENADMEYTNDGGATWNTLTPGDHMLTTGGGLYELREIVNGSVSRCAFKDRSCSSNFNGWMKAEGGAIRSADSMFFELNQLVSLDVTDLGTEYCGTFNDMFSNCSLLTQLDTSNFNTSLVTNTSGMFNGCSGLTSMNLDNFDTDMVTDMSSMFAGCASLLTLDMSTFITSSVVDFSYMFWGCNKIPLIDISSFSPLAALDTTQMFSQCCTIQYMDLTSFDTQNVQDMKAMFYRSNSLLCITNLDSTAANGAGARNSIFTGCNSLQQPDATDQGNISNGLRWANTMPCPDIPLGMPTYITDFAATDTQTGQITFTWTNATGTPTPTYDLWNSAGLVQIGVTSGYILSVNGTDDYFVKAINTVGIKDSNIDSGTGVVNPILITDFDASDTFSGYVRITFTEQ